MKLYKLKDISAIFWFFFIAILQYKKYYNVVLFLLFVGMLEDLVTSVTDIGNTNIKNIF